MVVTIDSKFYSKLQLGISKYQEKTPADPLKDPRNKHIGVKELICPFKEIIGQILYL